MKPAARLFFNTLPRYDKLTATDVKTFLSNKDLAALKATMLGKFAFTLDNDGVAAVTKDGKTVTRLKATETEVTEQIETMAENELLKDLTDELLESIYDNL